MRLGAEQLSEAFRLTNDYFEINNNVSDLNIVADTIIPTTPQRVEEVVPVNTSAGNVERERSGSEVAKAEKEKDSLLTTTRHVSDTLARVAVQKPKVDSVSIIVPISTSTAATREVLTETLPTVVLPQVLPADTIAYPILSDSLAIDTVSVAEVKKGISTYSLDGQKEGVTLPVKLDRSDGVFALLLVCFLLLAHLYNGGVAFFKENMMLVFSASKSKKLENQTTTKEIFYSYFLVFLAVLLISISFYEALDRFTPLPEDEKRPFVTIGMFIVLILIFILVKMMFNRLVGYIFDFDKKLSAWNRSFLVLLSMFGLLCFLPTLMLIYSDLWHGIIIGFVLVLFLIVQIILFIRVVFFFIERKFNFLYLIVYLCTIEILPYVFLGIGLVYLYRIDIFNTLL